MSEHRECPLPQSLLTAYLQGTAPHLSNMAAVNGSWTRGSMQQLCHGHRISIYKVLVVLWKCI